MHLHLLLFVKENCQEDSDDDDILRDNRTFSAVKK